MAALMLLATVAIQKRGIDIPLLKPAFTPSRSERLAERKAFYETALKVLA
jgi:hypothetical protein